MKAIINTQADEEHDDTHLAPYVGETVEVTNRGEECSIIDLYGTPDEVENIYLDFIEEK